MSPNTGRAGPQQTSEEASPQLWATLIHDGTGGGGPKSEGAAAPAQPPSTARDVGAPWWSIPRPEPGGPAALAVFPLRDRAGSQRLPLAPGGVHTGLLLEPGQQRSHPSHAAAVLEPEP